MSSEFKVYVDRVLEMYDPYDALGLTQDQCMGIVAPVVMEPLSPMLLPRDVEKDLGRIRFFTKYPHRIDAIEIDNSWYGTLFTGLVLVDGHHRLIAADLRGIERIPCTYGGWVDLLEYLEGKTDVCPVSL